MRIGEIDVPMSILDLEHRMLVMEQLMDFIVSNNQKLEVPSQNEYDLFRNKAIKVLQKKYPSMGIIKKS